MGKDKEQIKEKLGQYVDSIDAMLRLLAESGLNEEQVTYLDLIRDLLTKVPSSVEDEALTPAEAAPKVHRGKILVVDSDLVHRIFARRLLEKEKFQVTEAVNGKEALKALTTDSFNLVLLECQIPLVDGFETTETIRAHEQQHGGHVPIVAFTAHRIAGYRERCLQVGMDDYLRKPATPQDVLSKVALWLKK